MSASFQKWRVFRERKCNFSLEFPAYGLSDHDGPRSKVVLPDEGYAWALVLGSFDKLRMVGVFSYLVYFYLSALLMVWLI